MRPQLMWYTLPELSQMTGECQNLLRHYANKAYGEGHTEMVDIVRQGSRKLYQSKLTLLHYIEEQRTKYYHAQVFTLNLMKRVGEPISCNYLREQRNISRYRAMWIIKLLIKQCLVERLPGHKYGLRRLV